MLLNTQYSFMKNIKKQLYDQCLEYINSRISTAENAIKIISDPEILEQFRKRALEVAQSFSIEKIVPLYENLYKQAIKKLQ